MAQRSVQGSRAFHAGQAAELSVASEYERRGYQIAHQRWRGAAGEIDLIVRNSEGLVFVEVKKSASFEAAANRLARRQISRIYDAAAQYLAQEPQGQLTNVRFDAALVDAVGNIQIIENAFGLD